LIKRPVPVYLTWPSIIIGAKVRCNKVMTPQAIWRSISIITNALHQMSLVSAVPLCRKQIKLTRLVRVFYPTAARQKAILFVRFNQAVLPSTMLYSVPLTARAPKSSTRSTSQWSDGFEAMRCYLLNRHSRETLTRTPLPQSKMPHTRRTSARS
jgi:hypothetical protein